MPVRIGETKNRHTRHQILNKIIILWAGAIIGGLRRGSRPRRVEQTEEQQEKKKRTTSETAQEIPRSVGAIWPTIEYYELLPSGSSNLAKLWAELGSCFSSKRLRFSSIAVVSRRMNNTRPWQSGCSEKEKKKITWPWNAVWSNVNVQKFPQLGPKWFRFWF